MRIIISIGCSIAILAATHLRADIQPMPEGMTLAYAAAKGLEQLQRIPEDELFSRFCSLDYDEQKQSNYQQRTQGCLEAVSLIRQRLSLISSDISSDVIDLPFFEQLNTILTGENTLRINDTMPVHFEGVSSENIASFKEIMEFGNYTETKFNTGVYALEPLDCISPDIENISYFLKWINNHVYTFMDSSEPFGTNDIQRHANCYIKSGDLMSASKAADHYTFIASIYNKAPYLLNSSHQDTLKTVPFFKVIGMKNDVLPSFLEHEFTVINNLIEQQGLIGSEQVELMLAKVMRFIFLAHPFYNGNTRTFTVILNMIRLTLDLPPQSHLLNVRKYSSREIIEDIRRRTTYKGDNSTP